MIVARLFSGFDGAGEGIRSAGFELSWAIEYDPKIAAVAQMNGHNVIVADILDIDPCILERPDIIHASPVCTNASVANVNGEEAQLDRDTAMKTVQFVEILRPQVFTLENVWQYRNFQSFAGGDRCEGILPALKRMGYKVNYWHINSADYGVPQTRKRLILVAALDFNPERPQETHYNTKYPELAHPSLFSPARIPWVGWYEAIEDLIPTLPESQFAPWQLERLPEGLKQSILVSNQASYDHNAENYTCYGMMHREADEPAMTLRTTFTPTAFLVHPTDVRSMPVVQDGDPAFTVMTNSHGNGNMARAFLVNGALSGEGTNKTLQIHSESEPTGTIVASMNSVKDTRAWLSQGKVVKMTPRALARFQSFSDSYKLPDNNALACKGIGNACPPKLFDAIYKQIAKQLGES